MPKHNDMHDIEKLITMIKDRPAIYDYSCPEHKNKEHTEMLWKQISDELNMEVSLLKSKWLALRNSYSREIRNEKEALSHPFSIRRKRRKWYLADDMAFLREFLNYGQVKRNSINDGQIEIEDDNDDSNTNDEVELKYSPTILPTTTATATTEENDLKLNSVSSRSSTDQISTTGPTLSLIQHQHSTARNLFEDSFKDRDYNSFKEKRRCEEELNELREQNMTFFKSILPDILKLTERRQRLFKQEVLSVLNNFLDEQDMGP